LRIRLNDAGVDAGVRSHELPVGGGLAYAYKASIVDARAGWTVDIAPYHGR